MDWITRLERRFGAYAIPNLSLILVIGQAMVYLASASEQVNISAIALIPPLVLQGDVYRLFSFIFFPPGGPALFVLIGLYVFWMMGTALEHEWGAFRFNLYLLISYLGTITAAMAIQFIPFLFSPIFIVDNYLIGGTVMLAFAMRFPNFEFLIFFVLPMKAKYIALIAWLGYGLAFITGQTLMARGSEIAQIPGYGNSIRLLIIAGLCNFFIFFGRDIIEHYKAWQRREAFKRATSEEPDWDDEDE